MMITNHVPPPLTWHISQIIIDVLFPILSIYVLYKSYGHRLLFNALHVTITMTLKFKKVFGIATYVDNVMENDSNVTLELWIFACH
jgi:hypothetical protein